MKDRFAFAAFYLLNVIAFLVVLFIAPAASAGELRLIMFEKDGCVWCARWHAEIGPAWPNTAEAQVAPLTHLDIHEDLPEGVELARPVAFTPVFVLIDDGIEVGRIEGYPGDNFFWFLLDELLEGAGAVVPDT